MSAPNNVLHGLFNQQLETYEKVVALDLMDHRSVYAQLREELRKGGPPNFTFLDLACGSATASLQALAGLPISRYVGVDVSEPSLGRAALQLAALPCPHELRHLDFVDALQQWDGPVDAIWIGMSLHHLHTREKAAVMTRAAEVLSRPGVFMIWEPTLLDNEDRAGWIARFKHERARWAALSDKEFEAFLTHMESFDFPERSADWLAMGRSAGFEICDEVYVMRNRMGRVYRYRQA
jgi:ubiquinone/menaquinone biosynthesis C-methylase UbiE